VLLVLGSTAGPRVLGRAIRVYTEIILGLPILVLLYLIYFVLPQAGIRIGEVTAGLLTLTLYYSPYMAEAIRGAIAAVPAGQVDAARMIGLNPLQVFARILLPQTLGLMIPPLTGILIGLAKDTAILSVISVHELSYVTKRVVSRTYAPFEVWTLVAAIYWVTLTALDAALRRVEWRVTRFRMSGAA
jgi:polar amino acid transport system permease protein